MVTGWRNAMNDHIRVGDTTWAPWRPVDGPPEFIPVVIDKVYTPAGGLDIVDSKADFSYAMTKKHFVHHEISQALIPADMRDDPNVHRRGRTLKRTHAYCVARPRCMRCCTSFSMC